MNHLDKWPKFKKNKTNDYYDNQLERYQTDLGIANPIISKSTTDNRFVGYYQGSKNEALVIMYHLFIFADGQTPNTNTYYPVETGWLTAPASPKHTIPWLELNNFAPFGNTSVLFWHIENSPIRQTIIENIEASPYSYKIALDINAEYVFELEARPFSATIGRGANSDPAYQPTGDTTGRTTAEIQREITANINNDEWGVNNVSTITLTSGVNNQKLFNTGNILGATERIKGFFRIQDGVLTSDELETRYDNMNTNPTNPTITARDLRCRTRARLTPNGYLYFDTSGFNLSGQDDHAFLVRVYINRYL